MKKICLIEDQKDISKNIKDFLEIHDFFVKQIFSGEEGLNEAIDGNYDLILLDIGLPKLNGFLICEKILKQKQIPIIFITAREFIEDKIFGLKLGAQDYIIKPFDLRELLARITIHLKNSKVIENEKIEIGKISLDFGTGFYKNGNRKINLPQKEIEILKILLNSKDNIVSRTKIIEEIWGESGLFDCDGKLDVYISNIRNKLGKNFIKTVKGIGYKIDNI